MHILQSTTIVAVKNSTKGEVTQNQITNINCIIVFYKQKIIIALYFGKILLY